MWHRQEQTGASFVLGMMAGAFIGAGVALLFAPRNGQETRELLGRQYRGLADRVNETTQTLREQGRERAQQLSSQLSDRISSAADRLSSAADRLSSTATTTPTTTPTGTPTATERMPSTAPSV